MQPQVPKNAKPAAVQCTWGCTHRCTWAHLAFQSCMAKEESHQSKAGNLYFGYQSNHTVVVGVAEMWPTAFESFYETEVSWDLVFWGVLETQDSNWLWLSLAFQCCWYGKYFLHFFAYTESSGREWRPPKNVQLQANGTVEDEVHCPMYKFLNTQMSLSRREGKGRFGY